MLKTAERNQQPVSIQIHNQSVSEPRDNAEHDAPEINQAAEPSATASGIASENEPVGTSSTSANTRSMITRAKVGIVKPNRKYFLTMTIPLESKIIKQALQDHRWMAAMEEEMQALDTWSLVSCTPKMNVVSTQWVFKTKK